MATKPPKERASQQDEVPIEDIPVEELLEHLLTGDGAAPALESVNETLMPGGAVLQIA